MKSKNSNQNKNMKQLIVPCRFNYLHCFEPYSINSNEPKYGLCAIIPKSDSKSIEAIKKAIKVAKEEAISKWGNEILENFKTPLKDGDIEHPEDEVYRGFYFFNANSKDAPQVVDAKVQPIYNRSEVYSGCYGRISVRFYSYKVDNNCGVAAYLGNIQKIKSGEPINSKVDACDEFEIIDEDDFLF